MDTQEDEPLVRKTEGTMALPLPMMEDALPMLGGRRMHACYLEPSLVQAHLMAGEPYDQEQAESHSTADCCQFVGLNMTHAQMHMLQGAALCLSLTMDVRILCTFQW